MYLLKNINLKNNLKICKVKRLRFLQIILREIKNYNHRFNSNSEYKHVLGKKWNIVVGSELDNIIGFIDVNSFIQKILKNDTSTCFS